MEDALVAEIKMLVAISDSKRGAIGLIYRKFPVMFLCKGFVFTAT